MLLKIYSYDFFESIVGFCKFCLKMWFTNAIFTLGHMRNYLKLSVRVFSVSNKKVACKNSSTNICSIIKR